MGGEIFATVICILAVIGFIAWSFYDRMRLMKSIKLVDTKKLELERIVSDAEFMLEEMNNFSDYIVTQMDIKHEELSRILKNIDNIVSEYTYIQQINPQQDTLIDIDLSTQNEVINEQKEVNFIQNEITDEIQRKVIPISSKHKEIVQLASKGMDDTEIARKLKMGKGEIQLILGVNNR